MEEFVPQRTSAYINQNDHHVGEMTVKETLDFSARCQGIGSNFDMLEELCRREKDKNIKPEPDIDIYLKYLLVDPIIQGSWVLDSRLEELDLLIPETMISVDCTS